MPMENPFLKQIMSTAYVSLLLTIFQSIPEVFRFISLLPRPHWILIIEEGINMKLHRFTSRWRQVVHQI